MKLDSRFRPELCVSTEGHQSISQPWLDAERKTLIATDGRQLVSLPVELDEGDTPGVIPLKALELARGEAKDICEEPLTAFDDDGNGPEFIEGRVIGKEAVRIRANGAAVLDSGITVPRPEVEFPEWQRVVPPKEKMTGRIGLSATLLKTLADGIGARSGQVMIDFDPTDPYAPFIVRPAFDPAWGEKKGDEFGVLMPIRLPDPDDGAQQ